MVPFRPRTSNTPSFECQRRRRRFLAGFEQLEDRRVLAGMPFGAMPDDTAEFLLGDVHVTVVLMESSSQTSPQNNNSETWTPASIASVKSRILEGLNWWEETLATKTTKHELNFEVDFTYADTPVITSYEPITRLSFDFQLWMYDFLNTVGFNTRGNFHSDIRAFNHAQRLASDSDWAFTIFIVNDENDADHQFLQGGFSRAFAFAGGEFLVSLGSRPASSIAHEVGHIFWAYDEYRPDGNYDRSRGYYNTPNLNSWDNPTPGFFQQPSIMTKDDLLATAFANHSSAPSTLEMVGWRDSDFDGIFDVLDVPLTLRGSGSYDTTAGVYRFTGESSVQTLPNRNPFGLKNDITLNRVSRAQYRIDGGAWQSAHEYHTYTAELELEFPVPSTATLIEIRTIDDASGVTSPIFRGSPARPSGVLTPGINGVVWNDLDSDGALDPQERGMANVTVRLVDANGQVVPLQKQVVPDDHSSTTRLNTVSSGVTLSAMGSGVADDTVASFAVTQGSTSDHVFASFSSSCGGYCSDWTTESRQLRIDFTSPVSTLSIDAIGASIPGIARLEIFGSDNQLLARHTTTELSTGQTETVTLNRQTADIKFAIARSHNNTIVRFDNLRFGPQSSAVTDENGAYSLGYLSGGQYQVQVVAGTGQKLSNPANGKLDIALGEGESKGGVDFGLQILSSPWQNPDDRFDVNDDGAVSPNDVLRVINRLNVKGAGSLDDSDPTPPYVDVSGDFKLSSIDALQVINEINRRVGAGAGEAGIAAASTGSSNSFHSATPEGESASPENPSRANSELLASPRSLLVNPEPFVFPSTSGVSSASSAVVSTSPLRHAVSPSTRLATEHLPARHSGLLHSEYRAHTIVGDSRSDSLASSKSDRATEAVLSSEGSTSLPLVDDDLLSLLASALR